MDKTPEEFEKLQRLLKVKRHELPPPTYFSNFSSTVIKGIERLDNPKHPAHTPWLRNFFNLLETNPFAAGVFGASICGLLVAGIAWSQYHAPADFSSRSSISMNVADNTTPAATPAWTKADNVNSLAATFNPTLGSGVSGALFTGMDNANVQPVNYSPR